ncbi:MAG: histidine phosphatase family protein [Chloroflexi bacterium]|nr:histidine phosphatase family protein [Chloroflexota bacterium]
MPPHLILVRHSAVDRIPGSPARLWQLSVDGRTRAHQFAPRLLPYQPTRFITSQEPKAADTGQIMADALGIPCHIAPGLHEHEREGVPYYDSQEVFITAVENFFLHPEELLLGQETAVQTQTRFTQAVHSALTSYPDDTLVIAAHGTVITLFIQQYNPDLNFLVFWRDLTLPAAVVLSLPDFHFITQLRNLARKR